MPLGGIHVLQTSLVCVCFVSRHTPHHRIDYASLVLNAEQSLERKWRKYFGGKSFYLPFSSGFVPSNNSGWAVLKEKVGILS